MKANLVGLISNFKKDHPDSEFAWQNSKFNDLTTIKKQMKHEKYSFGGLKCLKKAKLNILSERRASLKECLIDFEPIQVVQDDHIMKDSVQLNSDEKRPAKHTNYKVYNTPGIIKVLSRMI